MVRLILEFNQPLNNWNVSDLEDMSSMFAGATSFNGDISGWNTSNVETMRLMFAGATAFNQYSIGKWDLSNCSGTFRKKL